MFKVTLLKVGLSLSRTTDSYHYGWSAPATVVTDILNKTFYNQQNNLKCKRVM